MYVCMYVGIEMSEDQQKLYRKLKQVRDVFEYSPISGINRKLQMKPQKWEEVEVSADEMLNKDENGEKREKRHFCSKNLVFGYFRNLFGNTMGEEEKQLLDSLKDHWLAATEKLVQEEYGWTADSSGCVAGF